MFVELNMNTIPNNTTNVIDSSLWNTLIPSHPELLDDISNDKEND